MTLKTPKWRQVAAQTPGIPMALVATWYMNISTNPGCSRTDVTLGSGGKQAPTSAHPSLLLLL